MSGAGVDFAVAAILWLAVIAYAVLAGADFGGGVWDLFARGSRAEQQRRAISRAMGPVWEANHVWLIFMITGLFTAFPPVFAQLAVRLYLPFTLVAFGIVCRGVAFAFRAHAAEASGLRAFWGRLFGVASIITPFLLGAAAGAVAGGQVGDPRNTQALIVSGWTSPFALLSGAIALAVCAGLAAAYLTVEEAGLGHKQLERDFRVRALFAGGAATVLAIGALLLMPSAAPSLWSGLRAGGLPLAIVALACAPLAGVAMVTRRYKLARTFAVGQVAAILGSWAFAQAPYLMPPGFTVEGSAAPTEVMATLLVAYVIGAAVLLPSLYYLFRVFKGRNPAAL